MIRPDRKPPTCYGLRVEFTYWGMDAERVLPQLAEDLRRIHWCKWTHYNTDTCLFSVLFVGDWWKVDLAWLSTFARPFKFNVRTVVP